jgi:hypothetical protein
MIDKNILGWLLKGDVSVQYQVHRDILQSGKNKINSLQRRISREGWGKAILSKQRSDGHWGRGFYQPKWTSSHYTLLDLKNLGISPNAAGTHKALSCIIKNEKSSDGGVNPAKTISQSDVCVNGMFLNYASYFNQKESDLISIVDFILSQHMPDGGFNCCYNHSGAKHSSLHSTISVIEGICEYKKRGYTYRVNELNLAEEKSKKFILKHKLFKSDRTGKIINKKMLMLSWPSRWYYDILRCLEYFRSSGTDYHTQMDEAVDIILKKRRSDKKWPVQTKHPGATHIEMESPRSPSRWNTLRVHRVFKHFGIQAE